MYLPPYKNGKRYRIPCIFFPPPLTATEPGDDKPCLQISEKMPFQQVISESIPVLRCRANWPRNHINLPPTQVARVYCPREREPPNCFCLVDTRACLRIGLENGKDAVIYRRLLLRKKIASFRCLFFFVRFF
ncbi:hypothetical protein CDAR_450951 [Caerostris darwini]|uniref:Uncharacterized protein n=1 Tax=Caerostris darwini TaxID=1538125 RepID=A0AAV4PMV9_9ARAC|nr:hypothetical protein CDAR_450951 [Caerostris darwini]